MCVQPCLCLAFAVPPHVCVYAVYVCGSMCCCGMCVCGMCVTVWQVARMATAAGAVGGALCVAWQRVALCGNVWHVAWRQRGSLIGATACVAKALAAARGSNAARLGGTASCLGSNALACLAATLAAFIVCVAALCMWHFGAHSYVCVYVVLTLYVLWHVLIVCKHVYAAYVCLCIWHVCHVAALPWHIMLVWLCVALATFMAAALVVCV